MPDDSRAQRYLKDGGVAAASIFAKFPCANIDPDHARPLRLSGCGKIKLLRQHRAAFAAKKARREADRSLTNRYSQDWLIPYLFSMLNPWKLT